MRGIVRLRLQDSAAHDDAPLVRITIPATTTSYDLPHGTLHLERAACNDTLKIDFTPNQSVRVQEISMCLDHDFTHYDRVLANGYQSWTDTHELPLNARQRGLEGTPKRIVDTYCLDGSGDYRFYRYTNTPGHIHGWTFVYFRRSTIVTLIASLNENRGFTLFEWRSEDHIDIIPETPAAPLEAGKRTTLGHIGIFESDAGAYPEESIDCAFDAWLSAQRKHYNLDVCKCAPLTGYSSWYRHYENITADKLLHDLAGCKQAFDTLDTAGFTRIFQIDDGYARVGDWQQIDTQKFPQGLKLLCAEIEAAGFLPGLWMAPFVCERASRLFAEHPDWVLRDSSGEPVRAGGHWSGSIALDTRNTDVRTYVLDCLSTATRSWGFKFLKLDFLYAACMIPHDGLNRGELMRDALTLVRHAVGPEVLIDVCGVPLASAFGLANYCRIGCDVGLDWDGAAHMRMTERERVSTKNSIGNTVYRAPLDGRAFGCDPDVVLLRPDVAYTPEQRRMMLVGDAAHASMLLTSDDPSTWTADQAAQFQEALNLMRTRKHGGA